jgi:hypothetical protein
MKRQDQLFMVGRRTAHGTTVVLLRAQTQPVFRGPWTVRAVVTPTSPPAR